MKTICPHGKTGILHGLKGSSSAEAQDGECTCFLAKSENILKEVLQRHGRHQIMVAVEELSELIKALSKVYRYSSESPWREDVVEELADVLIVCKQMTLMLGITEEELDLQVEKKLQTLSKLMGLSL